MVADQRPQVQRLRARSRRPSGDEKAQIEGSGFAGHLAHGSRANENSVVRDRYLATTTFRCHSISIGACPCPGPFCIQLCAFPESLVGTKSWLRVVTDPSVAEQRWP